MRPNVTNAAARAVLVALVLCLAPFIAVAEESAGATEVTSVEGITEYQLANGLRFLLFPDQSKQQITVNITYLVGSRHEGYGETGMAHLLEHLLFKGTPNHPDIPAELTERGAFPNGTTWLDRTNYFETFPANDDNLVWALDLEADRMVNSFVSKDDLDSEMTVVRNEMESGENNPVGVLQARVASTAYLWHNYGNSTIGARADVENVPIDRLQAFYRKYYQPDNAVLVVAGRFEPARAIEIIEEKFGVIPRPDRTGANQLFETYTAEPAQDGERTVTLRRVGDFQLAMAAYHIPAGSHAEYPAVQVLAHLAGDPTGRKALQERRRAGPGRCDGGNHHAIPGTRPPACHGTGSRGRRPRCRDRRHAGDAARHRRRPANGGGSQSRRDRVRVVLRPRLQQSAVYRPAAQRVGGDGRLAAHVPAPGPGCRRHTRSRPGRGRQIPQDVQPDPGLLLSDQGDAAA